MGNTIKRQFINGAILEWDESKETTNTNHYLQHEWGYELCVANLEANANIVTHTPPFAESGTSFHNTKSILSEAHTVIYGDREKTYGDPGTNLKLIAEYWGAHLKMQLTVEDVCLMMIMLKVARLRNDYYNHDSQVDICGYAALMERVQNHQKEATKHIKTSN